MEDTEEITVNNTTIKFGIAIVAVIVLLTVVGYLAYTYNKNRQSTVVLPGGITYLGPSNEQKTPTAPLRFTIENDTQWKEYTSKVYQYTFSYPVTLSLVVFPNDPLDSVAISWGNIAPQQNILVNIENVKTSQLLSQYVNTPKIEYVENWWRQFSGLKGAGVVKEFTNAKGLKGYKAKFINLADQTPNDDVFFEVPGHEDLMIRIANGILDPPVFDRIVDTLGWPSTK